ncbi:MULTISPECIES: hypothetical protein [Hyphomicrobiales]|uniref:hypothetical protein n=1 Tax=Hyphomicrobiales TaxID=356 RepID=UPI00178C6D53|nr:MULTISPECIES: hypothetical protein [Hyphomicrobiales]MCX7319504.1 hypothetical protein [Hyphomicrobiales bacterium]
MPTHAPLFGSIEPPQVSDDKPRELLASSTRQMEVLRHGLKPGLQFFVSNHVDPSQYL